MKFLNNYFDFYSLSYQEFSDILKGKIYSEIMIEGFYFPF